MILKSIKSIFLEREHLEDVLKLAFLILMCVQKFSGQELNMNGPFQLKHFYCLSVVMKIFHGYMELCMNQKSFSPVCIPLMVDPLPYIQHCMIAHRYN